jgi:hypothetical protein
MTTNVDVSACNAKNELKIFLSGVTYIFYEFKLAEMIEFEATPRPRFGSSPHNRSFPQDTIKRSLTEGLCWPTAVLFILKPCIDTHTPVGY